MTRCEAVMNKLKEFGGWPDGVKRITIDCECRVFFDEIYMRGFIDPASIQELKIWNVIIENDAQIKVRLNDKP